uniref:Uncharacterized protein n=1 Tax=Rhizophora mucronata TaxID=61149 RepID=A0A2P2IJX7_RHIMU
MTSDFTLRKKEEFTNSSA